MVDECQHARLGLDPNFCVIFDDHASIMYEVSSLLNGFGAAFNITHESQSMFGGRWCIYSILVSGSPVTFTNFYRR
jgi:hypothetical protein